MTRATNRSAGPLLRTELRRAGHRRTSLTKRPDDAPRHIPVGLPSFAVLFASLPCSRERIPCSVAQGIWEPSQRNGAQFRRWKPISRNIPCRFPVTKELLPRRPVRRDCVVSHAGDRSFKSKFRSAPAAQSERAYGVPQPVARRSSDELALRRAGNRLVRFRLAILGRPHELTPHAQR
jgi:hypothetical protein